MSVVKNGLIFDNASEARKYFRKPKIANKLVEDYDDRQEALAWKRDAAAEEDDEMNGTGVAREG